jgi:adenosylcobyric acid synthase
MADLAWLRRTGLAAAIQHADVPVAGVCGGLQMMGLRISDPLHAESDAEEAEGLGLLPIETIFAAEKVTVQTRAVTIKGGHRLEAYQIHMGQTIKLDGAQAFARLDTGEPDGAVNGRNWGTYLHGVFHNGDFRRAWLASLGLSDVPERAGDPFDRLAGELERALDIPLLQRIIGV